MTRVLVVDDAVFMRRMLREIFEEAGYEVIGEANNGTEAIDFYAKHEPDIVTMDVVMPIKNGVEAAREIIQSHPEARIVMVSAIGQEAMILEAMDAGAQDYIVKPFRKQDVIGAVKRTLGDA